MSNLEVNPSPGATAAGDSTARRPLPPARAWTLALTAGLIAGFASWLIGEALHRRFERPAATLSGPATRDAIMKSIFQAEKAARASEAILGFGSLGGVLGLALGLAGGSARGSARAALTAAIVGGILGAAVGAALMQFILPLYYRFLDPDHNDLIVGSLTQAVIFAAIGAWGGAAFGIGLGDRGRGLRAVSGGLLGAIAGALVYGIVGALAFPLDGTTKPVSATWGSRLFARLAATTLASAGVAMGILEPTGRAVPGPGDRQPGS